MKANVISLLFVTLVLLTTESQAGECQQLKDEAAQAICNSGCTYQQAENGGCGCNQSQLNEFINAIKYNNCGSWAGSISNLCHQYASRYAELGCNW